MKEYYGSILEALSIEYIKLKAGVFDTTSNHICRLRCFNIYLLMQSLKRKDLVQLNHRLKLYNGTPCKTFLNFDKKRFKNVDLEIIKAHIEIIVSANYCLEAVLEQGNSDKISAMASALHNYPDFILHKYLPDMMDAKKFYIDYIAHFNERYNEDFLTIFKDNFENNHFDTGELIGKRNEILAKQLKWFGISAFENKVEKVIFSENETCRAVVLNKGTFLAITLEQLFFYDEDE